MGVVIQLTPVPTRTTTDAAQPLDEVLDVSAYKDMVLYLRVYDLAGSGSPSVTVKIQTSMQNKLGDDQYWQDVDSFSAVTTTDVTRKLNITGGLLQYIRWYYDVTAGTVTGFTFDISGIAHLG